ncbi:hypothetical protein MTR67_003360 [Solanum verrucosum]|uniref:Uncharacterized protein n=1 Tax=Solanum verrucosum TaxID=315347 RepID=A0AAF0PVG1_SOLVR|nr:hypothetical protein MTR67_003360 [Solanum verrucosum]
MLQKYVSDESYVLSLDSVELGPDLSFEEEPIAILDRQVRKLRTKDNTSIKVQLKHHSVDFGIGIKRVSSGLGDDFRPRVKETSDSCFDIESRASSIIDLHMLFVCTDVPDESQGSFRCFGNWVKLMVSAGLTFAKANRIRDLCLSDRHVA